MVKNRVNSDGSSGTGTGYQHENNVHRGRVARQLGPEFQEEFGSGKDRLASFEERLNNLAQDLESTRLMAAQQSPYQKNGLQGWSPRGQGDNESLLTGSSVRNNQRPLSQKQKVEQEEMIKLVQSTMVRLNECHHKLNTALVQNGYDVSSDNLDVDLYDQRNVIASTDPDLLSSNYETRIAMLNKINANLGLKLKRKKEKLALLTKNNSSPKNVQSEPRRSERLKYKKEVPSG